MSKDHKTSNAIRIIQKRFYEGRPERQESLDQERVNMEIAQKIYDLRQKAGLTQKQLAEKVGTTASVISRLEDADYRGHSLAMLKRIASALGKRVEIRLVTIQDKRRKT